MFYNQLKKFILYLGISFWVIFDWPQYGLAGYENYISKLFFENGIDLQSCNAVRSRGN